MRSLRSGPPDLVALGDVNTALPGLRSRDKWPEHAGRELGFTVRNLGHAGSTLADAFEKGWVERALTSGAHYVAVAYGVDDCTRMSSAEFAGLLDRLLYEAAVTSAVPALLTGVWVDPERATDAWDAHALEPFNEVIRRAAANRHVRLIDVAANMERETARGEGDLCHRTVPPQLNAVGSRLVAHLVGQSLQRWVHLAS